MEGSVGSGRPVKCLLALFAAGIPNGIIGPVLCVACEYWIHIHVYMSLVIYIYMYAYTYTYIYVDGTSEL